MPHPIDASGDPSRDAGLSRRRLFQASGAVGLGAAGAVLLPGMAGSGEAAAAAAAAGASPAVRASAFDPIRPPAVPLAVRSPYLSTWMTADNLAGTWPSFWTGHITAMVGLARIDGVGYLFLGTPNVPGQPLSRGMRQTSLTLTATSSRYVLEAGGVELTLTFLSPVEPGDLRRKAIPMSYVLASVRATDGASHAVSLYLDISGEWAHGDTGTAIGWSQQQIAGAGGPSVTSLSYAPSSPQVLAENGDMASWGTVVWNASNQPGLTWQIGQDSVVRAAFLGNGALADSADSNQPRPINDNWPVFGYAFDLGTVGRAARTATVSVGHVHTPAVDYLGTPLPPLWQSYWTAWQDMAAFFHADAAAAVRRCGALDARIRRDATAAGGEQYAALCALALRQAYAGTELVSRNGTPWAFLKEISSDGNVSTVDVTYPCMPVFLYLDPGHLGLILAPLLDYAENGGWPEAFAEHDLGSHYPNAIGGIVGGKDIQEDMPVEESANMLIMSAAYLAKADAATAKAFATAHYAILKKWADYLVANALDPGYQNQTDDFTGFIAHSANLALKGIIGIGAMGRVATLAGNTADAASYAATASSYIAQWQQKAQDANDRHLKLAYDQPGTWSLKYNGYPDALLGLGLVPKAVADEDAAWYETQTNQYGVPLDLRHSYTKSDWEMWTAAWLRGHPVSSYLISTLYDSLDTTSSRVPFTDWYDTISGNQVGFQARPVVGGVYALLSLQRGPS